MALTKHTPKVKANFEKKKRYLVGSWEHLEQIPTVTGTFVQAIFVQAETFVQALFVQAFVQIRNISAVTDTIWTKL